MMNLYIIQASLVLMILLLCWFMPATMPETLPFGVRIPPSRSKEPVLLHARREYQTGVLVIGLLVLAIGWFSAAHYSPIMAGPGSIFATLILAGLNYYAAHQRIARAKERGNWYQGLKQVVMTDTDLHTHPIRPSLIWLVVSIISLCAIIAVVIIRYPALPAIIPIHFGLNGEPDRWASKTTSVILQPLIATLMTAMMIILAYTLPNTRRQLDPSNPQQDRQRQTRIRKTLANILLITAGIINLTLFLTTLVTFQVLPAREGTAMAFLATILPLALAMLLLIRVAQQNRTSSQTTSERQVVARDDDRYWVGGIFYYNQDDPSLVVEKRFGIGWTINFGHPHAKIISAAFILIIILSMVLSTLSPSGK